MNRKPLFSLILTFLLLFFLGCEKPHVTGVESEGIDTSQDPVQSSLSFHEPIIKEMKGGRFTFTPLAEYKLTGMVVSKESYSSGWESMISPYDLAIVWGKLAEPRYDRYLSYSQRNRWYFYTYKKGCPLDESYIVSHSSNNHIIPDNENIRRALKTIKRKDKVILEGFLGNVKGVYKGQGFYWNTSLARNDTGNGSCELIYVYKIRINENLYE